MKIIVTEIIKKRNTNHVLFECAYGHGEGVWGDEKALPGSTTHVEFHIEELNAIVQRITVARYYAIEVERNITYITGNIAEILDEIICLRFAETLIQFDSGVETLAVGEWVTVSVRAENLSIYPINL